MFDNIARKLVNNNEVEELLEKLNKEIDYGLHKSSYDIIERFIRLAYNKGFKDGKTCAYHECGKDYADFE